MTHALEELDIGVDRGRLQIERSPRWVRAFVDGQPIADSKQVLLVFAALTPCHVFLAKRRRLPFVLHIDNLEGVEDV